MNKLSDKLNGNDVEPKNMDFKGYGEKTKRFVVGGYSPNTPTHFQFFGDNDSLYLHINNAHLFGSEYSAKKYLEKYGKYVTEPSIFEVSVVINKI